MYKVSFLMEQDLRSSMMILEMYWVFSMGLPEMAIPIGNWKTRLKSSRMSF